MTLDSHMYRNPMHVLQDKQAQAARKAKACGGCPHAQQRIFLGQEQVVCTMARQTYGVRCHHYWESK